MSPALLPPAVVSWNPLCATCVHSSWDSGCYGLPQEFANSCMPVPPTCERVCSPDELDSYNAFTGFMLEYNKAYQTYGEWNHRYEVFTENNKFVSEHTHPDFSVAMNYRGDMNSDDMKSTFEFSRGCDAFEPSGGTPPDGVDHRGKLVTPVKDQGQCGSCWAFSTTGAVEGLHALTTGELVPLSEEQLVECSTYGDHGCEGGLMDYGFAYVKNNGLCSEDDYPYTAEDGVCVMNCTTQVTIAGCKDVSPDTEADMVAAVAVQPVSVAIEADSRSFSMYSGGVYSATDCGTNLDHGVLVVGYTPDYWIVKNSWGDTWGENGYINIARDGSSQGMCGILMQPSFPI